MEWMRDEKLREAWGLVCLETVSQTDLTSPPPMPPKLLALKTPLHPPNTPPFSPYPHQ